MYSSRAPVRCASLGHVARSLDVDPLGQLRLALAAVDVRDRGQQRDLLRPDRIERGLDARRIGDVDSEPVGRVTGYMPRHLEDFKVGRGRAGPMRADKAARAENQKSGFHGCHRDRGFPSVGFHRNISGLPAMGRICCVSRCLLVLDFHGQQG